MSKQKLDQLLDQILEAARSRGWDQKTLLQRAGLGPTTLSKLKRAEDARLSTLERLANAVGLTLGLAPREAVLERLMQRNLFGGHRDGD